MPTLLVCSATDDLQSLCDEFQRTAKRLAPDVQVVLWPAAFDHADVVAVAAWNPPAGLFPTLPQLKFVASIGAGIEHILQCPDLPADLPITRIVDLDQAHGMAEYVLWAALHFHRGFDRMLAQQAARQWRMPSQANATKFHVGILGAGGMGKAVALRLRDNGFTVSTWSRSPHALDGIASHAGADALPAFLGTLDMVVCLLPLTDATHGICNATFFAAMKTGSVFVNAGRGQHLVLPDLLAALDRGHLRSAVLDVFDVEPLPPEDPLWSDPRIIITPHMASAASDNSIASQILGNVLRAQSGQALKNTITSALQY
jgi:glyoxylate/hydroxypyruvate reductase A